MFQQYILFLDFIAVVKVPSMGDSITEGTVFEYAKCKYKFK